jgi:hypothetical protein
MTDWPTLSRAPQIEGYRVYGNDPTERSESQDGLQLDRPGCAELVTYIDFNLRHVSTADKTTLDTFQNTTVQIGAYPFNFTETVEDVTYVVRLRQRMEWELEGDLSWRTSVKLKEDG